MNLPSQFQFSQSSIQDYTECPRRFELRYILQVKWPAPITEPVIEFERHIEQGIVFHQMVQQYLYGIPLDKISMGITDHDLQTWWDHFIHANPLQKYPGETHPEYRLSIPFNGYRLVAQYDLIIMGDDGKIIIFDWKTSRTHPKRIVLERKAQTILYPFILTEAGFRSKAIKPEHIEMVYWYPNFPLLPDQLQYSPVQHQKNRDFIRTIIEEILQTPQDQFKLTSQINHCLYCNYRSLCDRGDKAGDINQLEDETDILINQSPDINFNSAPEIQF